MKRQSLSEGERKFRTCTRKKSYHSQEAALGEGQRAYQCPYCKLWHTSGGLMKRIDKIEGRLTRADELAMAVQNAMFFLNGAVKDDHLPAPLLSRLKTALHEYQQLSGMAPLIRAS